MTTDITTLDTLSDAADWRFDMVLADPETGVALDLTASDLKITFRALADGAEVATCSTAAQDGSLTIPEPQTGKVSVVVLASARKWRAPFLGNLRLMQPATVIGDILRLPTAGDQTVIEGEARVTLLILPSTTRW